MVQGPSAIVHAGRALDCGAGIGRVSKKLLLPLFSEVDLLEQNPAFLERAKTYLVRERELLERVCIVFHYLLHRGNDRAELWSLKMAVKVKGSHSLPFAIFRGGVSHG